VLQAERAEPGLLEPGAWSAERFPECPDTEALQAFAAGACSEESAAQVMAHVADCGHCAPLLRTYLQVVAVEEEEEGVDEEGKRAEPPAPARWLIRIWHRIPSFIVRQAVPAFGLAVMAIICVAAGPPILNAYNLHRTEKLIAAAFRDNGAVDMRHTWSPYPRDGLRRAVQKPPSVTDSPTLAAASQQVADKLNSSDPRWLRLRGRVKLLLWEDAEAAKLLDAVAEQQMNDPDTRIDLAVARFERDTRFASQDPANKTPPKLTETFDALAGLLREPNLSQEQKAVVLFDLAVVYEKMLMWDEASSTWTKYLVLDPSGPWHDQALRNLEGAEKEKHQQPRQQGYRKPFFFRQHSADADVRQSLEEYQDIALREWLAADTNDRNSEGFLATRELAGLMEAGHGDSWLSDFLRDFRPGQSQALRMLSNAVTYNKQGRNSEAEKEAARAAAVFAENRNAPGLERATFERVYASQRLLGATPCLDQAAALDAKLQNSRYRWLQAQTTMERAICLNLNSETSSAIEQLEIGRQKARTAGFRILALRAQALEAAMRASLNCDETWRLAQAGLDEYWRGPSAPMRLYELYSPIKQCLEKEKLWYAAEAMERRLITILEKEIDREDENAVLEATAHSALNQILREVNDDGAAEDQAKLAILLLGKVDRKIAQKYEIPIKLELADLQLDRGDTEAALATVENAKDDLKSADYPLLLLSLLRVQGDVHLRRQQWNEAENDYKRGLEIAERRFHDLKKGERRFWTLETGDLCRGLVEVLLLQKRDQEALQLREWFQTHRFAEEPQTQPRAARARWPDIEQTVLGQPMPPASGVRLVYASTRDRLYIWLISSAGIRTVSVPAKRDDLQALIRQFIRKCSTPQDPDLPLPEPDREGRKLFSLLLQPVIAELRGSETVVVDLDMGMEGLLVEALKSPEGWYFGQRYPVIYSPGYIRENGLRRLSQEAPRFGLLLNALTRVKTESAALQGMFPGVRVLDNPAIETPELASLLEPSEVFVFIGHSEAGALILKDKPLRAEDFNPAYLRHLQLAVLAACSTGLASGGPLDSRLDTSSLVDAFQAGGTPLVIASQWDVHSTTTADLMTSFYTHLKSGESAAHALYEARREMFGRNGHYHPYYWAGFVLNGRA
jgi:CHAT domain-containing protein